MTSKYKRITVSISLLFIFSIAQVYVGMSFAAISASRPEVAIDAIQNQATGSLTTRGNQPIQVNGNYATTDTTILPGATIDTPQGVGATINLGSLGRLDVAPNSSLKLDFGPGNIKVTLTNGCVILRTKKGTTGSMDTPSGPGTPTDPTKDDMIDVCQPEGAGSPVVGQGAAAKAGAGAATPVITVPAGTVAGGTGGGMSTTTGVIIGAIGEGALITAAILVPCRRGRNPSPGEPRGRNEECR